MRHRSFFRAWLVVAALVLIPLVWGLVQLTAVLRALA